MATLDFSGGEEPTVGMELELQLLDAATFDLSPGILPLLARHRTDDALKPEYFQSAVEICSPPFATTVELEKWLISVARDIRSDCAELGMRISGGGTHPFCSRPVVVTPLPRYLGLAEAYGHLVHHQITFALQVHVRMPDGDTAMGVMRRMIPCMPALVAVAANSPFWRGVATAFASYRRRVVAASRSYGMPPSFAAWDEFDAFMTAAQRVGMAESVKDLHWDIRPQPELGTIEIRAADAPSTLERAVAIAAFLRALAVYLARTTERELHPRVPRTVPWWLARENHFRASHRGLSAHYVRNQEGSVTPMHVIAHELADLVAPIADELGDGEALAAFLASLSAAPGYAEQRAAFDRSGAAQGVAKYLAMRFDDDLARYADEAAPPGVPRS